MSAQSNQQASSPPDNPNLPPQSVDSGPTQLRPAKTILGLKRDGQRLHNTVLKDNYEERFPEDPYCQEAAPNARVWRTYEEEAAAFDAIMVGQSRDGLDVMLVFAGLFSAVVTSFLVQISQKLEADFSQMSAILLHDLLLVQLSMAAGSSDPNITAPSVDPTSSFTPDSITVWINGLWAVSLTASLIVALAAVLVKQWLHHYTSLPSGTPGTRSHIRQYRFMGLQKWRVSVVIGLLPIIMHTSLALFLAGLILFFIPLWTSLAWAIGVITIIVTMLYFISNLMPIFFPQCPYQTPLTHFAHHAFLAASSIRQHLFTHEEQKSRVSLRELETEMVSDNYDMLSIDAMDWLFDVSSNPTVHSIVVQALGGLPASIQSYTMKYPWRNGSEMGRVRSESFKRIADKLEPASSSTNIPMLTCAIGCEDICDRLQRSFLFLPTRERERRYAMVDDGRDVPHFQASLWLGRYHIPREWESITQSRLRACLVLNRDVELHPLVWVNLIKHAIHQEILAPKCLDDSTECATIINLWFEATCTESPYLDLITLRDKPLMLKEVPTVLLRPVLAGVPSKEPDAFLQDHLLKFLSIHDELQDSSVLLSFRLALAVGKFGISHVAQHLSSRWCDPDGWHHLHLINCALDFLTNTPRSEVVLEPIRCFIIRIIDTTPVCVYNPEPWEDPIIGACLMHCLSRIRELLRAHDIVLPPRSLHRFLHLPAQHFSQNFGIIWRPASFPFNFFERTILSAFDMFLRQLSNTTNGAHIVFVAGDWLRIAAESWVVNGKPQRFIDRGWKTSNRYYEVAIVECYLGGLPHLPSEVQADCVEYIHKPWNLLILFLMLVTEKTDAYGKMLKLRNVCPTHGSWAECYARLTAVFEWCRNPDGAEFPLDGFFQGKVARIDDVEVSLDDEFREFLGQDEVRARLKSVERVVSGQVGPSRQYFIYLDFPTE